MAKVLYRKEEDRAREIDKSNGIKNCFRWAWLESSVTVELETQTVTTCLTEHIRKVDVPGKVLCILCQDMINYGNRGARNIQEHIKTKKHKGQERYGNMTRVYYREAVGALVVFDMTRSSTFQAVLKWKGDLDSKVALSNGRPVPVVLLANKCDQRRHGLCPKLPKLENFSQEYGFVGWYETSAKDNTNIDAAIMCLVKNIMLIEEEKTLTEASIEPDSDIIVLPRFDYNMKEKRLDGCSGCSSIKPKRGDD